MPDAGSIGDAVGDAPRSRRPGQTALTRVRLLKATQITVAVLVIVGLAVGLLWPGIMGVFLVPAGLLYLICAIRAALDKRLSIWLAFMSTVVIAVYLGAIGVSLVRSAIVTQDRIGERSTVIVADPGGTIVELPGPLPPAIQERQLRSARRVGAHGLVLLAVSAGAWLVIGLHAVEWRWAAGRRR